MAQQWSVPAAYLERLAEASEDGMCLLGPRGRIRYMNRRAAALLDRAAETAPGAVFAELWPAESRASLERALAAAAGGETQAFRAFFHGDGDERAYWDTQITPVLRDDGVVSELLVVSRDVTEAVETQAFLQSVIQLLPAPLTVKNVRDRRYILMNRAAEDLLNLLPDEGLGRTAEDLMPADVARTLAEADAKVLGAGGVLRLDHRTPGRDGEARDFTFKLLATHDDLGPRHLLAIGDDITDRKAAEESLASALHAAEQASRAKSAFIANMSHEIRTPLNGVMAGADMLARRDAAPETRELAAMIRTSAEVLNRLLSDVLEIARAESGEIAVRAEAFHVGETIRGLAAPFRLAAEQQGLALDVQLSADLDDMALGDAARIRQVLTSLISNALKFTDRGGVEIEARRTTPDRARFCVRDTGIGFNPAGKDRLFDRFHQADASFTRRFDGAGLGLSIAKDIVGRMGGRLDCDSRPGGGSAFWFEIPLAPAPQARDQVEAPLADGPQAGLRVLLADDHPTNRQVIQLMMSDVADVVGVENGAEAVEAFQQAPFDVVLMDMQMPVMDGHGGSRTPVVMISANAAPEHRAASAAAGADRHLAKPITIQTLFSTLEEALACSVGNGARAAGQA